jgi:hypothetical protein
VYGKSLDPGNPSEDNLVSLSSGKIMGLSFAYCDNDEAGTGTIIHRFSVGAENIIMILDNAVSSNCQTPGKHYSNGNETDAEPLSYTL